MNCKLFLALFVVMIAVQLSLAHEEEWKAAHQPAVSFDHHL